MKIFFNGLTSCVLIGILMHFLSGCGAGKQEYFAMDEPVETIALPVVFPVGLIYTSSPDPDMLIGTKRLGPESFEIGGYDRKTGSRLWQLPFAGNVVGETDKDILVYETKTATVHFIKPADGKITRKITPQPDPLTSPSALYAGMAFTDELYITTKPLYKQVISNNKIDTTWKIGITAKAWGTNEQKWFVPPVKQIVIIEYPPIVKDDKVLIVNPEQRIGHGHSYQILSVKNGEELHRGTTVGTFYSLAKNRFFERTDSYVKRIDPFTQKEVWRIDDYFQMGQIWGKGNQVSILARHADGSKNVLHIVDAVSGNILIKTELPFFKDAAISGACLTRKNQLLLHFRAENDEDPGTLRYDYWVHYDPQNRKALWRTDFQSESLSSLIPFVNL